MLQTINHCLPTDYLLRANEVEVDQRFERNLHLLHLVTFAVNSNGNAGVVLLSSVSISLYL